MKGWCVGCSNGATFGWFLVGFGVYFLLKDLGVIPSDFPLWQLILIGVGVLVILGKW